MNLFKMVKLLFQTKNQQPEMNVSLIGSLFLIDLPIVVKFPKSGLILL